jgi:hypothetical protein
VANLPVPGGVPVHRVILSGGEVLVWPDLLFHALQQLRERFSDAMQLWVQTNGDLLDRRLLDRLLEHGVCRIDVSSMDQYHWKSTVARREQLEGMFQAAGMAPAERKGGDVDVREPEPRATFAFWGATEDEWIGPLWPRGRALKTGLVKATPADRFCSDWSGAKNFLNYWDDGCEVNIQLADVYPCCPMTCRPIGSLLDEPLLEILDRCSHDPVFEALNEGRPEAMGVSRGISEEYGFARSRELGNHCLWCDEFFTNHATHLLTAGARTERGASDLVQLKVLGEPDHRSA